MPHDGETENLTSGRLHDGNGDGFTTGTVAGTEHDGNGELTGGTRHGEHRAPAADAGKDTGSFAGISPNTFRTRREHEDKSTIGDVDEQGQTEEAEAGPEM